MHVYRYSDSRGPDRTRRALAPASASGEGARRRAGAHHSPVACPDRESHRLLSQIESTVLRRWRLVGNLNGHEPVQYPHHWGKTVSLLREPRSRLLSECAAIDFEFRRAFGSACRGRGSAPAWATHACARSVWFPVPSRILIDRTASHAAIRISWSWKAQRRSPCRAVCHRGHQGLPDEDGARRAMRRTARLNATLLKEATRRVLHDFAFVGLTDRWNASVCLFHAKYGGEVYAAEFANSRPGGKRLAGSGATEAASACSTTRTIVPQAHQR